MHYAYKILVIAQYHFRIPQYHELFDAMYVLIEFIDIYDIFVHVQVYKFKISY